MHLRRYNCNTKCYIISKGMRNVINISLPPKMAKEVARAVRKGGYATTSEFFRHLIRLWNTRKLAEDLHASRSRSRVTI